MVTMLGSALYDDDVDLYRAGVAEGWAAGCVLRPDKLGSLTDVIDNSSLFTAIPPPHRALRVVLAHRPVLVFGPSPRPSRPPLPRTRSACACKQIGTVG